MISELERYQWVERHAADVLDAISITLVGPTRDDVIAALEPRRQWPTRLTVAAALDAAFSLDDWAWGSVLAQVDEIAGWATLIEPCGWAASMPDTVARLSAGGTAVNVFWNVNAVMSASVARDGAVVREFDPLLYDGGEAALPEETGLPFGEPGAPLRAACFAFLARVTGIEIDESWLLERTRPTFVVPVP